MKLVKSIQKFINDGQLSSNWKNEWKRDKKNELKWDQKCKPKVENEIYCWLINEKSLA